MTRKSLRLALVELDITQFENIYLFLLFLLRSFLIIRIGCVKILLLTSCPILSIHRISFLKDLLDLLEVLKAKLRWMLYALFVRWSCSKLTLALIVVKETRVFVLMLFICEDVGFFLCSNRFLVGQLFRPIKYIIKQVDASIDCSLLNHLFEQHVIRFLEKRKSIKVVHDVSKNGWAPIEQNIP